VRLQKAVIEIEETSAFALAISPIKSSFQDRVTKTAKCNSNKSGQGQRSAKNGRKSGENGAR
jgi:hypothetical protein